MKKSILEFYALAVCFFTIICFAITLGLSFYSVIKIVNPIFTLNNYTYEKLESNENFCSKGTEYKIKCDDPHITQKREQAFSAALKMEQREGLQNLVMQIIILLVNLIIFIPHWLIARRARATSF